jgi:hypothetical protein
MVVACLLLGLPAGASAKDLSAALLAGAADLLAPYQAKSGPNGAVAEAVALATASGLGAEPAGLRRPQLTIDGLAKALMIGKQGTRQIDALAAIASAADDDAAMTAGLATLYRRLAPNSPLLRQSATRSTFRPPPPPSG